MLINPEPKTTRSVRSKAGQVAIAISYRTSNSMSDRAEEYRIREYALKIWLEEVLCVDDLSAFADEGEGSDLSHVLQVNQISTPCSELFFFR